ncbi:MAG TPA: phosphoribosyltransferase family protein [Actinopolymorphaceae bacterium]
MFRNRVEAGRLLAERVRDVLAQETGRAETERPSRDVVVLALPRGGVPVGFQVATALEAPLDVLVVRKLGVPTQPELAMGAIGENGARVVDQNIVRAAQVSDAELAEVEQRERQELERRITRFRGGRRPVDIAGKTVVIVDDGIATGATARAACAVVRSRGARRIILATPVAAPSVARDLEGVASRVVCLSTPSSFYAIGQFYADFTQTSDEEVSELLARASVPRQRPRPQGASERIDEEVIVEAGPAHLEGHLTIPPDAPGVVIFAHGSGSSRHSRRNRFVAAELNAAGLGSLLVDLLTTEEELDRGNVFDISLLSDRLIEITHWLRARLQPEVRTAEVHPGRTPPEAGPAVRIGYFGASTGAAAALSAAAELGSMISAVVSRGGRPDLAAERLPAVTAPTLLIVGGRDELVLELNQYARELLGCENELRVVPGAGHLFEEPGTLEVVAAEATRWFRRHFTRAHISEPS